MKAKITRKGIPGHALGALGTVCVGRRGSVFEERKDYVVGEHVFGN